METDSRTFLRAARSRTNVPFCEVTTEGPLQQPRMPWKRRAGARIDDDASDCQLAGTCAEAVAAARIMIAIKFVIAWTVP